MRGQKVDLGTHDGMSGGGRLPAAAAGAPALPGGGAGGALFGMLGVGLAGPAAAAGGAGGTRPAPPAGGPAVNGGCRRMFAPGDGGETLDMLEQRI